MPSRLNGSSRRSVDSGDLPPLGSDEYHRALTTERRARRRDIDAVEGEESWPEEEPTGQFLVIPQIPHPPNAPVIRYEPVRSLRAAAGRAMESRPLQVGAIVTIIGATSAAIVAIIEAIK